MALGLFRMFSKTYLGIDIGSFSIKIVELSRFGRKTRIENYIQFRVPSQGDSLFRIFGEQNLLLLSDKMAEILNSLLKKAGIREKKAFLSIPDFSTFFTTFELPPMTMSEIPKAVEFEARHHIPFPLSEVTFDWQTIKAKEELGGRKSHKVLLVAVPNKVLQQYQRMATLSNIQLKGLEAETFALMRSSVGEMEKEDPICLVDIGYTSTTISIAENGLLRQSYSFDISANSLTRALVNSLKMNWQEAEKTKQKFGLDPKNHPVFLALRPQINSISKEIERVCQNFYQTEGRKVEDIIFAGGAACLPGLKEYFKVFLKKDIKIANPFHSSNISYPPLLEGRLKEVGPSFAIALGLALRGIGQ